MSLMSLMSSLCRLCRLCRVLLIRHEQLVTNCNKRDGTDRTDGPDVGAEDEGDEVADDQAEEEVGAAEQSETSHQGRVSQTVAVRRLLSRPRTVGRRRQRLVLARRAGRLPSRRLPSTNVDVGVEWHFLSCQRLFWWEIPLSCRNFGAARPVPKPVRILSRGQHVSGQSLFHRL